MTKIINRLNISPFVKDVLLTAVMQISTIFSIILVMRILAKGLGPVKFGAYLLSMRTISVVAPLSTLSIGTAITRYTAGSKDDSIKFSYLLGGVILGIIPAISLLFFSWFYREEFSLLIFRSVIYKSLMGATLISITGYSFYIVMYSFYRGLNKISLANTWNLWAYALVPLIIAINYVKSKNVYLIVLLMALGYFLTIFPLIYNSVKGIFLRRAHLHVLNSIKDIFIYSIPRVPGGLLFTGMLAVGPFLAPSFGSIKDAGYLLAGQSIFRVLESALFAFGFVALPKVSQLISEEKYDYLKERIADIISFVFHTGSFIVIHILFWVDILVLEWLGNEYAKTIIYMKIFLTSAIFYLFYTSLRAVIDAVETKAVNTINLCFSFFVAVGISYTLAKSGLGVTGLAIGTMIGFLLLGFLTVFYLWKIYKFDVNLFKFKEILFFNVVLALIAYLAKNVIILIANKLEIILVAFFMESILFIIYLFILRKMKVRWMLELKNRIYRSST